MLTVKSLLRLIKIRPAPRRDRKDWPLVAWKIFHAVVLLILFFERAVL